MYKSLEEFKNDAVSCGSTYYPDKSLQPENIQTAFEIYQNALGPASLGMTIVGRLALKNDNVWIPSNPDFPSIDEIMRENLGEMNEKTGSKGSILNTTKWSLLANDAWLLGSIHANTEFHLASPLSWSNLWDIDAQRMTVTAREAIGISTYFTFERPTKLEAVATCNNKNAINFSLVDYKNQVDRYAKYQALRNFYLALPPTVTYYSIFNLSELTSGDNTGISLNGANLAGANLQNVQLIGANLSQANLPGANLENANLANANLYGAILENTSLTGVGLVSPVQLSPNFLGKDDSRFNLERSGKVFFRKAVLVKYNGNKMIISAIPEPASGGGSASVYTDDQVRITVTYVGGDGLDVSKQSEYLWDYSHGNQGRIDPEPPTDITQYFESASGAIGLYLVSIELIDLYHNSYGSSGYWLVEDANPSLI